MATDLTPAKEQESSFAICTNCIHIVRHRHRLMDSDCGHPKNVTTNFVTGIKSSLLCTTVNHDGNCKTFERHEVKVAGNPVSAESKPVKETE